MTSVVFAAEIQAVVSLDLMFAVYVEEKTTPVLGATEFQTRKCNTTNVEFAKVLEKPATRCKDTWVALLAQLAQIAPL